MDGWAAADNSRCRVTRVTTDWTEWTDKQRVQSARRFLLTNGRYDFKAGSGWTAEPESDGVEILVKFWPTFWLAGDLGRVCVKIQPFIIVLDFYWRDIEYLGYYIDLHSISTKTGHAVICKFCTSYHSLSGSYKLLYKRCV